MLLLVSDERPFGGEIRFSSSIICLVGGAVVRYQPCPLVSVQEAIFPDMPEGMSVIQSSAYRSNQMSQFLPLL